MGKNKKKPQLKRKFLQVRPLCWLSRGKTSTVLSVMMDVIKNWRKWFPVWLPSNGTNDRLYVISWNHTLQDFLLEYLLVFLPFLNVQLLRSNCGLFSYLCTYNDFRNWKLKLFPFPFCKFKVTTRFLCPKCIKISNYSNQILQP